MSPPVGIVYLVGAGPGDPGLITVRGRELLRLADVVVHDRLVAPALIAQAKNGAEILDVGKAPGAHRASQDQINALLIDRAKKGRIVVRLKGGDPFVFGRGCEEVAACRDAGVDCIVVPGVSSALAAPAAAGVSVTRRGVSRHFAVVTAETAAGDPPVDFARLVNVDTLVILMGRERLRAIAVALIAAGRSPTTPVCCIERAATPAQRVLVAALETVADRADLEGFQAPMVTIIGEVAADAVESSAIESSPLLGRRVVITRPLGASRDLEHSLITRGAIPVSCPLLRIEYPRATSGPSLPLGQYAWIAFTSRHGVIGFKKALRSMDLDARCLAGCKVAAVGEVTARALRRIGLQPDLVSDESSGVGLADKLLGAFSQPLSPQGERLGEGLFSPRRSPPQSSALLGEGVSRHMLETGESTPHRVLLPRGDLAMRSPVETLRAGGVAVDEWTVYHTKTWPPTASARATIEAGVDAVLFFSPSAARSFVESGLTVGDAVTACIGPTTATAARELGLDVDVIATDHSATGLVNALTEHFQSVEVGP